MKKSLTAVSVIGLVLQANDSLASELDGKDRDGAALTGTADEQLDTNVDLAGMLGLEAQVEKGLSRVAVIEDTNGSLGVVLDRGFLAPGAPEGGDAGVLPLHVRDAFEKGDVLRVRAGPASLDVMHPEGVERFGDSNLVRGAEIHAFALRAVAQGGVIQSDFGMFAHGEDATGLGVRVNRVEKAEYTEREA